MKTVIKKIKILNQFEKEKIINFLVSCFLDNPDYKKSVYTNPDLDTCILFYQGQELIEHADITRRTIEYKDRQYLIAGVGDVAVKPQLRHSGLGTVLMKKVNEIIKSDNYDLGLLFCHPDLDQFYSSCGWIKKENGKIYATVNGVKEDQRRTYFLPIALDQNDINYWNTADIEVGVGSW